MQTFFLNVIFFCSFLCIVPSAFATLSLSVNPMDGSNDLRFERVDAGLNNKKEIRVRVTSTGGKQYQVFQRVFEPIINEKGQSMDLQAIETVSLSGSNTAGALYIENGDHLGFGEQLLYTSGHGGESDGFILGYSLAPNFLNAGGNFAGKLVFTVRSPDEPSGDQVLVNVFVDNTSMWKASVVGGHSLARVRIQDSDTTEKTADYAKISFAGNPGQQVRVYQEIESPLRNEAGQDLGADVLQAHAAGDTDSLRAAEAVSVGHDRLLIYSDKKDEDNFVVYFLMNAEKIEEQEAGIYRGRIKYTVETNDDRQEFLIDIECQIEAVFTLDVVAPAEGVSFANVLPTTPPQDKEVMVTVRSNFHKPYQVLQNLQSTMTNEKGKEISNEFFNFKIEIPAGQKGQTRFGDYSSVEKGEYPIFSSDGKGSPAVFKVIYRLQGYAEMDPGNFLAQVRFSLNQN